MASRRTASHLFHKCQDISGRSEFDRDFSHIERTGWLRGVLAALAVPGGWLLSLVFLG